MKAFTKALGRLLSSLDYQAETFDSGRAFLDSLVDRCPDFLVLDLHMPGLSGLDVLQQLTRTSVPVRAIVITAYDEPETQRNAWPPVPWPISASRLMSRCSWVQSGQQRVTTRDSGAREKGSGQQRLGPASAPAKACRRLRSRWDC